MDPAKNATGTGEPTDNGTPDFIEQDDILGASVVSQEPLPEYHDVGQRHLKVIREALEDRAGYENPEDSIYFVPHRDPSGTHIDELQRHRVKHVSEHIYVSNEPAELVPAQYDLLQAYFEAIRQGAWDIVQQLLRSGLLEANTTGARCENGCTPLMTAVKAKQKKVMILLLENGALIDGWSGLPVLEGNNVIRTPLMIAASQGDLPTVKWLMEGYGADDSIVAPDGQLALRLAAEAGHEHVVAYLPTRRGGVYRRWKAKQAKHLSRIRRVFLDVWWVAKAIFYEIPKWLTCELIVYPVQRVVKWCWKKRHHFLPFVKRQIAQFPEKVSKLMRRFATWIRKLPTKIKTAAEQTWRILRSWPGEIQRFVQRIPGALKIAWTYIMEVAKTMGNAVKQVLDKIFSLLHTAISAIFTFFRHLTFANLITAIADLLEAIFVSFPVKIWSLIENFWETGCRIMEHFFGLAGTVLWCIGYGFFRLAVFLPEQLLRVCGILAEMGAASWRELRVWWNPKAI